MFTFLAAAAIAIFGFSMAAEAQTKWDVPRVYSVSGVHAENAQVFADVLRMGLDSPVKT